MALTWPLSGGPRRFPITRSAAEHQVDGQQPAVDLACPDGQIPVLAVAEGVIEVVVDGAPAALSGCGKQVDLSFSAGGHLYLARYCHLHSVLVAPGQPVADGAQLGIAGRTGTNATGPHLHLALFEDGRRDSDRVDPQDHLEGGRGARGRVVARRLVSLTDLAQVDPSIVRQLADWQRERRRNGEDSFDYPPFRQHVIALGAPDCGEAEFNGFCPPAVQQLRTANPQFGFQLAQWQRARRQHGEDPHDYPAFRLHLTGIGAPDCGDLEFEGFRGER